MNIRSRSSASFRPFFAPDVPHAQASNAALDGSKNRAGRRPSDTRHKFPRVVRTTQFRSQSIARWPFLNRNSRPHLPNSLTSTTPQRSGIGYYYLPIS